MVIVAIVDWPWETSYIRRNTLMCLVWTAVHIIGKEVFSALTRNSSEITACIYFVVRYTVLLMMTRRKYFELVVGYPWKLF
jgi:hypothetical protein